MNMKKTLMIMMITSMMLTPLALGDSAITIYGGGMVKEECVNNTHLYLSYNATFFEDDVPESYSIGWEQYVECTHNCTNGKCNATYPEGDNNTMWMVYGAAILMMVVGMVVGLPTPDGERSMFRTTVRMITFFVGMYFLSLSLSMARGLSYFYGGVEGVRDASGTAALVCLITILLFLFVYMYDFIQMLIPWMQKQANRKKYGKDIDT